MMQHKVELSTMLRVVVASENFSKPVNVTKALAQEAIASLQKCDTKDKVQSNRVILFAKNRKVVQR